MAIRIIITGGTIDDVDYDSPENAPKIHQSLVPGLLKQGRIALEHTVDEFLQKDSRYINEGDRQDIYQKCLNCAEDKIIITHGTITLSETAKYLGEKNIPKTIIILGAIIPANNPGSDALFNLGAAISAAQLLPHGVYVTMNGKIFSWNNVKKNPDDGVFVIEK